jgi:hypothetical protein
LVLWWTFFALAKMPGVRLWEEEADGKDIISSYDISFIVGGMSWFPQVEFQNIERIIPTGRMSFIVRIHI